jgi:hypothetical protein
LYFDKIESRFETRSDRFEEGALEKEGRYIETFLIWNNIFSFEDIKYSLFGKELFNTAGNYGYTDSYRVIHADLNIILNGSGLIGLVFYLFYNLKVLKDFYRFRKRVKLQSLNKLIWVISVSLLLASFATSFSSGLFSMTYRTAVFSLLGSFCGYLFKQKLERK